MGRRRRVGRQRRRRAGWDRRRRRRHGRPGQCRRGRARHAGRQGRGRASGQVLVGELVGDCVVAGLIVGVAVRPAPELPLDPPLERVGVMLGAPAGCELGATPLVGVAEPLLGWPLLELTGVGVALATTGRSTVGSTAS